MLLWRAWGTSGDARTGERNSWRGLCYISVMSCSCALVMHPFSFCDRWCGLSGGLLGAQCRVPRAGDSGAWRQVSVVDSLVSHVKNLEQLLAQLQHLACESKDKSLTVAELGMKLETRVREFQDKVKQLSLAKLGGRMELFLAYCANGSNRTW